MTVVRFAGALLSALLIGAPGLAQETGVLDRLRSLAPPPPPPSADDLYADDIAADHAMIAAEAGSLFDPDRPGVGPTGSPVAIALFIGPDCPDCVLARAELADLAGRIGIRANVIDVSAAPEDAALMRRLTLDLLPSYVLADGLIRGAMPVIVLERYLSP